MKQSLKDTGYRMSDRRELCVEAKIIVALIKEQPQSVERLCRNAKVNRSSFYRVRRLLINEGILEEIDNKYALWNFVELQSLWDRLRQKLLVAGGSLIDLKIEKLELGDERDPITGWYETIYDKLLPVQGIIILKGAKELETAASLHVPKEYLGFLLTQGNVEEGDRFSWRSKRYVIQEVEEVIDGYDVGYRIAKLVVSYHQP
jgi:transposase-like protein